MVVLKLRRTEITMNKDEEIKKLKRQVEELTNNWKRALADYQNLEKRVKSEKEEFIKFANSALILKLLNILDFLEKVRLHIKDLGLEMAITEFKKVLKEEGVEEIEIKNGIFDPSLMECIDTVKIEEKKGTSWDEKEGRVAEIINKGYKLNGRLLRPVRVKVYKK